MNSCIYCGVSTKNKKYCSHSCQAAHRNSGGLNKIQVMAKRGTCEAFGCTNKTYRAEAKLCETHKAQYEGLSYKKMLTMTLGELYSLIHHRYPTTQEKHRVVRSVGRRLHKYLSSLPCNNCGYDKYVELAHVNPVSQFLPNHTVADVNHTDNVVQLCPNCHWEFDKGGADKPVRDGKELGYWPNDMIES